MQLNYPHPWSQLVLGGVGKPRFLILDDNLVTKMSIDINDGWFMSDVVNLNLEQVADPDSYHSFMLRAWHTTGNHFAFYNHTFSTGTIGGKVLLLNFRAKSPLQGSFKVALYDSGDLIDEIDFPLTERIQFYSVVFSVPETNTDNTLQIRFYPSTEEGEGDLYFDNVHMAEVQGDITLPQPNNSYVRFEKKSRMFGELYSEMPYEVEKRYRPHYHAFYYALERLDEVSRQAISEAKKVYVFPHIDSNFGFLGVWDKEFERKYSFNRFFAHESIIPIKGMFSLTHQSELLGDPEYGETEPEEPEIEIPGITTCQQFYETPEGDYESENLFMDDHYRFYLERTDGEKGDKVLRHGKVSTMILVQ
jgi:hypothetical protein